MPEMCSWCGGIGKVRNLATMSPSDDEECSQCNGTGLAKTTLEKLEAICDEIFERWDKDQRSGKLLSALAGRLPGYRGDVDEVRAALTTRFGEKP